MHWLYFYLFAKVRVSTVDYASKKCFFKKTSGSLFMDGLQLGRVHSPPRLSARNKLKSEMFYEKKSFKQKHFSLS